MSNEMLSYIIVENLAKVIAAPLFSTTIEQDGSVNTELTIFGEKLWKNIIDTLNKEK